MTAGSERVMQLIRERIKHNRHTGLASGPWPFSPLELPARAKRSVVDHTRTVWSLGELLESHDRQFVQNAYVVLLKRDPDISGVTGRLETLRQGSMTRVELLFRLRYGSEGKIHRVRVKGLVWALAVEKLCAIPLLGTIPRTLRAIAWLPRLQRDVEEMKAMLAMQENIAEDRLDAVVEFQNGEFKKLSRILNKK